MQHTTAGRGQVATWAASAIGIPASTVLDVGGLQANLSSILGVDMPTAGWLIGAALTITLIVIGLILASKLETESPIPLLFLISTGMMVAVGVGWWPVFTIFVAVVIALVGVMGLFSTKG